VEAVRRYLVGPGIELPRIQSIGRGRILYDFHDPARAAHVFQVVDGLGNALHVAVVRAEFLAARSDADVVTFLERHGVGRALADGGARPLVVDDHGLTREAA
jgi:hypothetical protein